MKETKTKLRRIVIKNFKNVQHGEINFPEKKHIGIESSSEIVGVYGQNGSGKTALINSLSLLKTILSGQSLESYIEDYITYGEKSSAFIFDFIISKNGLNYEVTYNYVIEKYKKSSVLVAFERITYKEPFSKRNKSLLIETSIHDTEVLFSPKKTKSPISPL